MQAELDRQILAEKNRLAAEIAALQDHIDTVTRLTYHPNAKQREFHSMRKRERLFFAGNRCGKSLAGAEEATFHSTGDYPEWWDGWTFPDPTVGWVAGVSSELTRDVCQRYLLGDPSGLPQSMGTGLIPRDRILSFRMGRGLANIIDTVTIRHASGGVSEIKFKSYDQGRKRFQSAACNWAWPDEECPYDIYMELLTRTNDGGQRPGELGIVFMTFTPLLGMTQTVKRFYTSPEDPETMGLVIMALEDAEHFDEKQKAAIIASYPPHELRARTQGLPFLGSGLVYDMAPAVYTTSPIVIPKDFHHIIGIDPGSGNHPYGFAHCAIDRNDPENPVFYVIDVRKREIFAEAEAYQIIRDMGGSSPRRIPVAWPHDLGKHDRDSGVQLATKYREKDLEMLPAHATHPGGGHGLEAGVREIREAKLNGTFKVFETCTPYFEEAMGYHRVEGVINQQNDHVLDAVRKAWMMQRFAAQPADSYSLQDILGSQAEGLDYDPHAAYDQQYGGEW